MKITIPLLAALLFILSSCKDKTKTYISYPEYYRGMIEVKSFVNENAIEKAITKFDSLLLQVPHNPSSKLFWMARVCADNNKCDLASKYLELSIESGLEYGKGIGANKTIETCQQAIDEVLKRESEIHNKYFNFIYKTTIDSMSEVEQEVRRDGDYEQMAKVDSHNMIKILELIEKYGYPGENTIGHASAFNAFIILLHMDKDLGNKVFGPIMDQAYNDGLLWPRGLAWMVDRRRYWGPEKIEPYYYHMKSNKYRNFNLQELNEVNLRRDSIGLDPI